MDKNSITDKKNNAVQTILARIPDENLRAIIFGNKGRDFSAKTLNDSEELLEYTSRLLTVAFHFVYFRYRKWVLVDNCIDNGPENNDLVRIFKVLKNLYLSYDLSYDIIESILMDVQIDVALNGVISQELRILQEIGHSPDYAKMTYLAKQARTRARFNDDTPLSDRIDEFVRFTNNFMFTRFLKASYETIDGVTYYDNGEISQRTLQRCLWESSGAYSHFNGAEDPFNGKIETYDCIIKIAKNHYFLNSLDFITPNRDVVSGNDLFNSDDDTDFIGIKLNYSSFQSSNDFVTVIISDDESLIDDKYGEKFFFIKQSCKQYCEDNFLFDGTNDEKPLIEDFYSINYKYIRNLALAIVDVLDDDHKNKICHTFSKEDRYKLLFPNDGSSKLASLHWDVIIAILMVEEGAGKLLRILFENKQTFNALAKNLELRFGRERFTADQLIKTSKREIDNDIKNLAKRSPFGNVNPKDSETIRIDEESRAIVVNVTKAVNGNNIMTGKVGFPLSIRSHIQLLESIKDDTHDSNKSKFTLLKAIVNQALTTLIKFYRAFLAYAQIKKEFENESYYRVLTDSEINAYQTRAQNAFENKREESHAIFDGREDDFPFIMEQLKSLCKDCAPGGDKYALFKYTLGRQQLLDHEFVENALLICNENYLSPDDDFIEDAFNAVIDVLNYLQTGERNKRKSRARKELSMNAIFPYVATYQYAKQTGDGYHINNFSIISDKGYENSVKVMSEFRYDLNEKYYCLPNKQRSAQSLNLWIEPIMINYKNKD